jgi:hypothetical protein
MIVPVPRRSCTSFPGYHNLVCVLRVLSLSPLLPKQIQYPESSSIRSYSKIPAAARHDRTRWGLQLLYQFHLLSSLPGFRSHIRTTILSRRRALPDPPEICYAPMPEHPHTFGKTPGQVFPEEERSPAYNQVHGSRVERDGIYIPKDGSPRRSSRYFATLASAILDIGSELSSAKTLRSEMVARAMAR